MSNADFHARYAAMKAHKEAAPAALAAVRTHLIDFNGAPIGDGEPPLDGLTAGQLRTVVAEVDRLTAQVVSMQQEARDAEREFAREAREIAAEARWEERESQDRGY